MLADALSQVDQAFAYQWWVMLGTFVNTLGVIIGIIVAMRRRPSVDTDIQSLKQQIAALTVKVTELTEHRDDTKESFQNVASTLARLEANQSGNSIAIRDTNTLLHDMAKEQRNNDRAVESMIERKLLALGERIDRVQHTKA